MSTILSRKVIQDSTAAVDVYVQSAQNEYAQLEALLNTLLANGFIGEAADGYKTFFTQKVVPVITENLTDGPNSLMGALKTMMEEIGKQFMDTIDPSLGEANINAGQ